jgi:membrane-associated phospholipid phosphatase
MQGLQVNTIKWIFMAVMISPLAAQAPPSGGQGGPLKPAAQTAPGELFDLHPQRSLKSFAHEEYRIWTSPFRRSSYDAHSVKKYVIPFALISAGLIASDTRTADALPNTTDQTKWSGRFSQLGAAYSLAGMSGGIFLIGKVTKNHHAQEAGLLALEALAHTQVVVFGIKQLTNRVRPPESSENRGFWRGGDSFPSGHAASSFAVASVFAYEYRDHIAVPITAYTLASAISASRLSARRHWLSDIFVGGSTGFLLGRYVYRRHHDPRLPGTPVVRTMLVPDVGISHNAVVLAWHW